jgi:hypothetical protein
VSSAIEALETVRSLQEHSQVSHVPPALSSSTALVLEEYLETSAGRHDFPEVIRENLHNSWLDVLVPAIRS